MAWDGWEPKQVRAGAKHLIRILWDSGPQSVGSTERCAFNKALARGNELASAFNNAADMASAEQIIGAGGSA
jgi:hypothetical protein